MSRAVRNIAIIAHVDHGKTTLVDKLLVQAGSFSAHQHITERMMDSNDLEKERGITILAKNLAVDYAGVHINIVDTPGHADFGGEVERVLSMVDGVLLLVDAVEGPMPQTRFVTKKALALGLKPIVVVNKIDRDGARPDWVVDHTFRPLRQARRKRRAARLPGDLRLRDQRLRDTGSGQAIARHAADVRDDSQARSATARRRDRWAAATADFGARLLELRRAHRHRPPAARAPEAGAAGDRDVRPGGRQGKFEHGAPKTAKVGQVFGFRGLERVPLDEAVAGDIVLVTGIDDLSIGCTITDTEKPEALPMLRIDEPTLNMTFMVNNSPYAGTEGKFVTSRQIGERLRKELLTNMALRVEETTDTDSFLVSGRGELHLTILLETMRREGYELAVGRPR
jgi:GTP-binding protein